MPDDALRLYPPPTQELNPGEIHQYVPIIQQSTRMDGSLPAVSINMVASADGKASVCGGAAGIGSATDRAVMRNLRAASDAVMVGANTLRAERMSLGLDAGAGGTQPLAVVLTSGREAPRFLDNLILPDDQGLLLVVAEGTTADHAGKAPPGIGLLRAPPDADGRPGLGATLRTLKQEHGIQKLLVEGGPTLNRALVSAGLAHELFLTVAPKLLGGALQDAYTVLDGVLEEPINLRLLSAHLAGDELFLRYAIPEGQYHWASRGENFA